MVLGVGTVVGGSVPHRLIYAVGACELYNCFVFFNQTKPICIFVNQIKGDDRYVPYLNLFL